jgi:hypothetical protein
MGLIRKITSVSSLGAVDFKSDKERIATYTKQTRNELRKLNQDSSTGNPSLTSPWSPGQVEMSAADAESELQLLLSQRKFNEYKGYGGLVNLVGNALVITRKGPISRLQKITDGEYQIEFDSIYGVVNQDPNLATNGMLVVISPTIDIPQNRVLFTNQHKKEYEELLQILRALSEFNFWSKIEDGQAKADQLQSEQVAQSDISIRLGTLNDLLEKGLISEDEFKEKRAEMLGGL